MITEVRNIRSTFRVPVKERVAVHIRAQDGAAILTAHEKVIQRLGFVERLTVSSRLDRPAGSATAHLGEWDLVVPLAGLVDLSVERRRIEKELAALEGRLSAKQARLGDSAFRAKAPAEVVTGEEESLKELEKERLRWQESLKQIG